MGEWYITPQTRLSHFWETVPCYTDADGRCDLPLNVSSPRGTSVSWQSSIRQNTMQLARNYKEDRTQSLIRRHPHLLSLAKDVKLCFYTVPNRYRTLGHRLAVHYSTTPLACFLGIEGHVALDRNPGLGYNTLLLQLIPGDLSSACPHRQFHTVRAF